ncbi:MAG: redox-regulated ATPase YchF [Chloroflexota bacterium]
MSVNIGIIGLAQSGRTTVFNALTRGTADPQKHGEGPRLGTAKVPEPRLQVLTDMLHPKKVTPASVTYLDVGASVKELVQQKETGGRLLAQLADMDALINVVRAFKDDSIPHIEGTLDVDRDITNMDLELAFSDIALLEKRLERINTAMKGAKPSERQTLVHEQELMAKIKGNLEKDVPVRELSLTAEEAKIMANYQFLTDKPVLVAVNIGEDQLPQAGTLEAELNARYAQPKRRILTLCGKVEMELAQLDENEAQVLRIDFGINESGADRIIKLSDELLGLISFFTIASGEVRAWSIQQGTDAVKAAGKIHSDMERGFIRAEVIGYDDLVKCGSIAEARKKGILRLEGKTYTVRDGDVITFLFNV